MPKPTLLALLGVLLAAAVSPAQPSGAGSPALTGAIEGRVFDAGRGEFLENALVRVEGTTREALTDATGSYRLSFVPAGEARLRVFYTGLPSLGATKRLEPGPRGHSQSSTDRQRLPARNKIRIHEALPG